MAGTSRMWEGSGDLGVAGDFVLAAGGGFGCARCRGGWIGARVIRPRRRFGWQWLFSGVFFVERTGEIFVNGCGAAREGFVGSARAIGAGIGRVFFAACIFQNRMGNSIPYCCTLSMAGYPVVFFALVVALCADRHTSDRVTQFCWFSIGLLDFNRGPGLPCIVMIEVYDCFTDGRKARPAKAGQKNREEASRSSHG